MKLSDLFSILAPTVLAATFTAGCANPDGSPNRAGTAAVGAIGGAIVGGVIGDAIGGSQQRSNNNQYYNSGYYNQGGYNNPPPPRPRYQPRYQPQPRICRDNRNRQFYCLNAEGDQEQLFKHEEGAFDKEFQDRLFKMPRINLGS